MAWLAVHADKTAVAQRRDGVSSPTPSRNCGTFRCVSLLEGTRKGDWGMLALILLAILAIVLFGVGFTLHWLWIAAVVVALVWVISFFVGGVGGRRRAYW